MKKVLTLFFLIVFSFTAHALEDTKFCELLEKEIVDNPFPHSWISSKEK